eukprot:7785727-Lingulodinium_polyedra.AAC.1
MYVASGGRAFGVHARCLCWAYTVGPTPLARQTASARFAPSPDMERPVFAPRVGFTELVEGFHLTAS